MSDKEKTDPQQILCRNKVTSRHEDDKNNVNGDTNKDSHCKHPDEPGATDNENNNENNDNDDDDDEIPMDPSQVHQMALELFPSSRLTSWKTKRRREGSVTACATDLGQRLQQATTELHATLEQHFAASSNSGLSLPVTVLAWILILLEDDDDQFPPPPPPRDKKGRFKVLRQACFRNKDTFRRSWRDLFLQPRRRQGQGQGITHLRVTKDTWPLECTHRDLQWSHSALEENDVQAASEWLQAYCYWKRTPTLTPIVVLRSILPDLRVLWLDQVNVVSFKDGVLPALANQLQVLRIEGTNLDGSKDFFQDPEVSTRRKEVHRKQDGTETDKDTDTDTDTACDPWRDPTDTASIETITLYPRLTHIKITQCTFPSFLGTATTITTTDGDDDFPIWKHFPALEALSLSHSKNPLPTNWMVGLSFLTNLQRLDLSYNMGLNLERIHFHIGHLTELNVSHCGLTSCAGGLDHLYSLERLHLHHNSLQQLPSIRGLAGLPQLRLLTLHDNPLATTDSFVPTKQQMHSQPKYNKTEKIAPATAAAAAATTTTTFNHQSLSSMYRLTVLGLFWQAQQQRGGGKDATDASELPVLDHEPASPLEIQALVDMSFAVQLPVPDYTVASPPPLDTKVTSGQAQMQTQTQMHMHMHMQPPPTAPRRRRMALVKEAACSTTKRKRNLCSGFHSVATATATIAPKTQFDTADVLKSLRPLGPPPLLPRDNEELTTSEKDKPEAPPEKVTEPPSNKDNYCDPLELTKQEAIPTILQTPDTQTSPRGIEQSDDTSSSVPANASEKVQSMPVQEGEAWNTTNPCDADECISIAANSSSDMPTTAVPETANQEHLTTTATATASPTNLVQDEKRGDSQIQKQQQQQQPEEVKQPFSHRLSLSPIRQTENRDPFGCRRKVATVVLHNSSSSPFSASERERERELGANRFFGGGGSTAGSVASSRLVADEQQQLQLQQLETMSTGSSTLHSAMMLSFAVSEQAWARGENNDNSIPSSVMAPLQFSGSLKKYELAEKNSVFVGPHTYKQITIHDNLEIYFRLFVFSTALGTNASSSCATAATAAASSSSSNYLFPDPDELAWQSVLENFPRIKLWPMDRYVQEVDAACNMGPTGAPVPEEFRRVWRERVVGCGKPSLKRLTPVRIPRRGFHGEVVFPPSTKLRNAAGATSGKPEAVTRERRVILCCSTGAFYIIADHDVAVNKQGQQQSRSQTQSLFPKPIPKDACFAEAVWPHAMARHAWSDLLAISIGFNFQRLTLRFRNRETFWARGGAPAGEFCYILLTCNKLETIHLLKEFQDLTDNIAVDFDAPEAVQQVAIDNDDRVVLDGLASIVPNHSLGVVYHFQILSQYWQNQDRAAVCRLCVVTDSRIYLLDETYRGDGARAEDTEVSRCKTWGRPEYRIVDDGDLDQIAAVEAATSDPCLLTISIQPRNSFYRTHNWRLICRDREGAERLIEDVRKAFRAAEA